MWPNSARRGFRWPGASLRVRLVAVLLCLLAAGAAVIITLGASALHGQLIRQAGAQLRAYASQLTSGPFQVLGTAQRAPGPTAPFDAAGARSPGAARMSGAARAAAAGAARTAAAGAARMAGQTGAASSADSPGTVTAGIGGIGTFSMELRGPRGQLLLSVGPGTRPGQAVPAPFAPVPARTGVLQTVPATGGDYLVIAEPVHVSVRRLAFGYGADDFAVTSAARTGPAGTLVVGLRLAGIGHTVQRLTLLAMAVSTGAILIAGGLLWAAVRFSLRPVTQAAQTADAVAAGLGSEDGPAMGGLAQRVPGRAGDGLAGSLNTMLGELDTRLTASTDAAAAASAATGQLAGRLVAVADQLRRPISLLHGQAEHWAHRDRHRSADPGRALTQIAAHAADAEALLPEPDAPDGADAALFPDPVRRNPDKTPSDPHRSREEPPGS